MFKNQNSAVLKGSGWFVISLLFFSHSYAQRQQRTTKTPTTAPKSPEVNYRGQIVFIGASITQYWKSEGLSIWNAYYEPRGAVNVGVSGDKTQQTIDRITGGLIDGLGAKTAVLDIGSNDLGDGLSEHSVVSNIGKILPLLRKKLPGVKTILVALMPRADHGPELHQKLRNVNARIQKYDDGQKNVRFFSLENKLARGLGQLVTELFWDDKLHLNQQGYKIWAENMTPLVNQTLAGK